MKCEIFGYVNLTDFILKLPYSFIYHAIISYIEAPHSSTLAWKIPWTSILESFSPNSGESKLQHVGEVSCAGNSPIERSM